MNRCLSSLSSLIHAWPLSCLSISPFLLSSLPTQFGWGLGVGCLLLLLLYVQVPTSSASSCHVKSATPPSPIPPSLPPPSASAPLPHHTPPDHRRRTTMDRRTHTPRLSLLVYVSARRCLPRLSLLPRTSNQPDCSLRRGRGYREERRCPQASGTRSRCPWALWIGVRSGGVRSGRGGWACIDFAPK